MLREDFPDAPTRPRRPDGDEGFHGAAADYLHRFVAAMDDDFNSAAAFAVVHELVSEGNKLIDVEDKERLGALASGFAELMDVLGFSFDEVTGSSELTGQVIDFLLELREQARAEGAFERADAIRNRLGELGVIIEDTPAGPRWRVSMSQPGATDS